jgi:hypothetical protein
MEVDQPAGLKDLRADLATMHAREEDEGHAAGVEISMLANANSKANFKSGDKSENVQVYNKYYNSRY